MGRDALRLNPSTVLTPDNWIADITPRDSKRQPFRLGLSAHLSEEEAWKSVESMLRWRRVGPARIVLRRRYDTNRMNVFKADERREIQRRYRNAYG